MTQEFIYNFYVNNRKGQTHQWVQSDEECRYVPTQENGVQNYAKDAFDYKFNSAGFRSDEFTEQSDLSILFLGCSFTEGTGLPINEVWSSKLIGKIQKLPQHVNKKIPFFSLGLSGTGLDAAARMLHNYCSTIKPKYIFHLVTSYYRRELCYGNFSVRSWLPNFNNLNMPTSFQIDRMYTDYHYAYYESMRSLSLINAIANQYNACVFALDVGPYADVSSVAMFDKIYNDLTNIIRIPVFIDVTSVKNNVLKFARDNMHWGSWWHDVLVNDCIWLDLQRRFKFAPDHDLHVKTEFIAK